MKISMFSAALVLDTDPDDVSDGFTFVGTIELKFGDEVVMDWPVTANYASYVKADDTALDKFVAAKFREMFEKTGKLAE